MYSPKTPVDKLKQGQSPSLRRRSLQLPTPLRCEVRSPGFSSRLSSLIRENEAGTQQKNVKKALQPPLSAAAFNPKYQGFGSMPRVKLERRSLPRLAMKNSPSSVKSPGVTMVKVAPAEPFSPFRSNNTSLNSTPVSTENNVADPRRVLAALQELSRSRKRGRHQRRVAEEEEEDDDDDDDEDDDDDDDEEDEEEHGSKRARRDSSSSLGSSLSMEMPPLFSNNQCLH